MFTEFEMLTIRTLAPHSSVEKIAETLGIHRTTLERRLLKHHGLVLKTFQACELVPLTEFQTARNEVKEPVTA